MFLNVSTISYRYGMIWVSIYIYMHTSNVGFTKSLILQAIVLLNNIRNGASCRPPVMSWLISPINHRYPVATVAII